MKYVFTLSFEIHSLLLWYRHARSIHTYSTYSNSFDPVNFNGLAHHWITCLLNLGFNGIILLID